MKLLVFFIQLLLYVVLLTGTENALAGSKHKSIVKNKVALAHLRKQKVPGDIWDRIRAGMQIPQPMPAAANNDSMNGDNNSVPTDPDLELKNPSSDCHKKDSSSLTTSTNKDRIVEPAKLVAPGPKYTELGLQKLHPESVQKANPSPETKYTELGLKKLHPEKLPSNPIKQQPSTEEPDLPCANQVLPNQQELEEHLQLIAKQQKQNAIYDRVQQNISKYVQRPDYLQQVINNARPYLYFIVENLNKFKLPYELALLPIVESGYQPTALSVKSAAGLWQFIPSTGLDFNLKQSERYDDRLDIEASTNAAMQYFTYLKQHYNGDWLLTLAAYNCGLGMVDAAINDNFANGLGTDFWSLKLPFETQEYVPRLLALAAIFTHPANYQFKPSRINDEAYFIKVRIDQATDISYLSNKELKTVAQLADIDYSQLIALNPGFLNAKILSNKPFNLFMPEINAAHLRQRLNMIAKIVEKSEQNVKPYAIETQTIHDSNQPQYAFPFFTLDVK